jgi:hypothetical protein
MDEYVSLRVACHEMERAFSNIRDLLLKGDSTK